MCLVVTQLYVRSKCLLSCLLANVFIANACSVYLTPIRSSHVEESKIRKNRLCRYDV
jgi:hypothetical protein